jgi:hypothetical protein
MTRSQLVGFRCLDFNKASPLPNTRNARRAAIGKVTKVAAINASEVLQSVKIPD